MHICICKCTLFVVESINSVEKKKNDNYTDCVGSSPEVCGKMVIVPILLIMSFVKPFRKCE